MPRPPRRSSTLKTSQELSSQASTQKSSTPSPHLHPQSSSSLSQLSDSPQSPIPPCLPSRRSRAPPKRTKHSSQASKSRPRSHPVSFHTSHVFHWPQDKILASLNRLAPPVLDPARKAPLSPLEDLQTRLLGWYDDVKEDRQMPWRKSIAHNEPLTKQALGQRAYEVWTSEVMLQQTQVETVKAYYVRWMKKFPTIFDLAHANVEQVNECWQGLGYYSRASRLLSGAQKVVKDFDGILPDDPAIMEREVDGIGPYSAGAIASIAYGKPVAMIDGNVHRVLTRLTALHAPQTAKATVNFLWSTAAKLVPQSRPGDFNQALMELGATVCKPREAMCSSCPLKAHCKALSEATKLGQRDLRESTNWGAASCERPPPSTLPDIEEEVCQLCQPMEVDRSLSIPPSQYVLLYPMAKQRKKPSVRETVVGLVEWVPLRTSRSQNANRAGSEESMVLLTRRPEKGLLAGLWEFPSVELPDNHHPTSHQDRLRLIEQWLLQAAFSSQQLPSLQHHQYNDLSSCSKQVSEKQCCDADEGDEDKGKNKKMGSKKELVIQGVRALPEILHVFSHIRMTYRSVHVLLSSSDLPNLPTTTPTAVAAASDEDDDGNLSSEKEGRRKKKRKRKRMAKTEEGVPMRWIPGSEVLKANIGNPHKKVWKQMTMMTMAT